ncbi:MAG: hypothetical protein ACREX3_00060 [Gammaproteobacteria bacterium]
MGMRHKNPNGGYEYIDSPVPDCGCNVCKKLADKIQQRGERRSQRQQSNWTPRASQPPDVGVIAGTDHVTSFKTGGRSGDETLIADGDYSDDPEGFNRNDDGSKAHDHHGRSGSKSRGRYTGPGH